MIIIRYCSRYYSEIKQKISYIYKVNSSHSSRFTLRKKKIFFFAILFFFFFFLNNLEIHYAYTLTITFNSGMSFTLLQSPMLRILVMFFFYLFIFFHFFFVHCSQKNFSLFRSNIFYP